MPVASESPEFTFDEDLMFAGIRDYRAETAPKPTWSVAGSGHLSRQPAVGTAASSKKPVAPVQPIRSSPRAVVSKPLCKKTEPGTVLHRASQIREAGLSYGEAIDEFRKLLIVDALQQHRGNQCKAAVQLGVHRNTLNRHLEELAIDPRQIRAGLKKRPQRVGAHGPRAERAA